MKAAPDPPKNRKPWEGTFGIQDALFFRRFAGDDILVVIAAKRPTPV